MSDSVTPETTQPRLKRKRRWLLIVALVVGLILLVWISLLVRDGQALRTDVLALQDYATSLPQPVQPADIDMTWLQQRVTSLDHNLNALRSHAGPLLMLTPALGWLPEIGGDVEAAPALLDMALAVTDFGQRATTALEPLWPPETMNGRLSNRTRSTQNRLQCKCIYLFQSPVVDLCRAAGYRIYNSALTCECTIIKCSKKNTLCVKIVAHSLPKICIIT